MIEQGYQKTEQHTHYNCLYELLHEYYLFLLQTELVVLREKEKIRVILVFTQLELVLVMRSRDMKEFIMNMKEVGEK